VTVQNEKKLEKKYTQNVLFTGYKQGQELVDILSVCDVFVTPSKTETFGLTIIEALACNLPVAAYDVQGPRDIVHNGIDGYLGNDLEKSALRCLSVTATNCRRTAKQYSWEHATQLFFSNMIPR
jgi:glycosyltransferase involved in cell wall biosynthesis